MNKFWICLRMRILLTEDNRDIAASIITYLENNGVQCDYAPDGLSGMHLIATNEYDLYILDIAMPGIDGLELCRRVRYDLKDTTPIIFLTARDTLDDKIAGFSSGADDYLVKPFELQELFVRVQALFRRSRGYNEQELSLADLTVNTKTQEIRRAGQEIQLSAIQTQILTHLLQRSPEVVTRQALEHALWQGSPPDSDALRSHIYKIRQLIDKPFGFPLIHTVQGRGFRMVRK